MPPDKKKAKKSGDGRGQSAEQEQTTPFLLRAIYRLFQRFFTTQEAQATNWDNLANQMIEEVRAVRNAVRSDTAEVLEGINPLQQGLGLQQGINPFQHFSSTRAHSIPQLIRSGTKQNSDHRRKE